MDCIMWPPTTLGRSFRPCQVFSVGMLHTFPRSIAYQAIGRVASMFSLCVHDMSGVIIVHPSIFNSKCLTFLLFCIIYLHVQGWY